MDSMHATTQIIAFIEGIGGPELMMIMFIVLLLFGGQKLPEFAKGLGKSVREFKKAASNVEDEFKRAIEDTSEAPVVKPFTRKPVVPPNSEPTSPPPQS